MQNRYRRDLTKWTEHMDDTEGSSVFKRVGAHWSCLHHTLQNSLYPFSYLSGSPVLCVFPQEGVHQKARKCVGRVSSMWIYKECNVDSLWQSTLQNQRHLATSCRSTGQTSKQACGYTVHTEGERFFRNSWLLRQTQERDSRWTTLLQSRLFNFQT